ncbi:MAG: hypothetical protein LBQ64_01985 [Bacteroidales bacterium]|jgi:hypothetical protein|nr:hypothetical protein [Bacteroidales bacterium]
MRKAGLIFMFLCACMTSIYGQKVTTKLYANPHPCDSMKHICFYLYIIMDVEQEIIIEDCPRDTFVLDLEQYFGMQAILHPFFYQEMSLTYGQKGDTTSLPYDFDGFSLSCVLPSRSCTLRLSYLYTSDYFSRVPHAPSYLWPVGTQSNSWYFTCPNMKVTYAEITDYDSIYIVSNLSFVRQDNKLILNTSELKGDEDIIFIFLEKRFLEKHSFQHETNTINLFLSKGDLHIPYGDGEYNYWTYPSNRLTNNLIKRSVAEVKKALKTLNKQIFPLENMEINVYETDLSMKFQSGMVMQWGVSLPVHDDNKAFIVIDSNDILRSTTFIHELIHTYYNRLLPPEGDSTRHFFGEAITEYLAKCMKYDNVRLRDSVFNEDIIGHCLSSSEPYKIFIDSIAYNNSLGEYRYTPFVIHTFAQMMGENKFLAILSRFFKETKQNNTSFSFKRLEELMKENGVTDKQWNWFIKRL